VLVFTSHHHLPNRRASENFQNEAAGLHYTSTASWFEDERLAEIFLSNHKAGSGADVNARDAAVVCSLALQYGAPLETIRRALMRDSAGRPNGPLACALDRIAERTS
jgi:hypothetical protein